MAAVEQARIAKQALTTAFGGLPRFFGLRAGFRLMIGRRRQHVCESRAIAAHGFLIAQLRIVRIFAHASKDTVTEPPTEPPHEKSRRFFEVLGRCISAWATVDDELFRIFRDCLGPCEQSAIIFYKLPGLEPRLTLTDEIVASVFPKPERNSGGHDHESVKQWKTISKKFDKLLAIRRRLAHQPVSLKYEWGNGLSEWSFGTEQLFDHKPRRRVPIYSVEVGKHESLRRKSSDLQPLTERDLLMHLSYVRKLANELNEFSRVVLTRRLEECPRTTKSHGSDP